MKTSWEATSLVLAAKQLTSRRRDVPLGLQPAKRVRGTCDVKISLNRLFEPLGQSAPRLGPASQRIWAYTLHRHLSLVCPDIGAKASRPTILVLYVFRFQQPPPE